MDMYNTVDLLFYAMIALQVLDVATTYYAIKKLGAREVNGLMAKAMRALGLKGALALKLAIAGVILYYMRGQPNEEQFLTVGCIGYTGLVLWNLSVIRSVEDE